MVRSPTVIQSEPIWKALAVHSSIPQIPHARKSVTAISSFLVLSAFLNIVPLLHVLNTRY